MDLLICGSNQLTNLDVSQNIALTRLDCYNNNLQYLDMSQNTALNMLDCNKNQLTFLDVKNGKNNLLTIFNATNNQASICIQVDNAVVANASQSPYTNWNIDATATYSENCNTTIITDSNFEQALINLGLISDSTVDGYVDTSEISTITTLDISSKNISDLSGIEAFTSLTTLIVSNNQLTYLDLSHNTNLMYLDASNNPLTTVILTSNGSGKIAGKTASTSNINLTYIDISFANLDTIDISNIPNLQSFYAQGNNLIALDVSNNSYLTALDITNNPLTCTQVSQVQLDNIPTGWNKDSTTNYSTDCAALNLDDKELGEMVKMYPNPVNDLLHIDTEIALVKVELYSMLGQKVLEVHSGFNAIPIHQLSKGMYIVKLYSEAGTVTKKLIKE